jgi:hypothetical protein
MDKICRGESTVELSARDSAVTDATPHGADGFTPGRPSRILSA